MAWNIVGHAFVIVFGNFKEALKASVVPFLVLGVTVVVTSVSLNLPINSQLINQETFLSSPKVAAFVLITLAMSMFVFAWVAVTWHRFILQEEYPTIIPKVKGIPIGGYIARSLMLALQMFLVFFAISFVLGIILQIFGTSLQSVVLTGPQVAIAIGTVFIITSIAFTFVWLRVGISLPSTALDKEMGTLDAWVETDIIRLTIFFVSIIMVSLNFVGGLVTSYAFVGFPFVSQILSFAVQWITMMVGISVLTTIYGHVVEDRPLTGT